MFAKSPSFSVSGKKFNVIILASGLGARLKPETDNIPKPLVELDAQGTKAIDYLIQKFQYVASRLIITTAYCADLLEAYVKGKYSTMDPLFARVPELISPGASLIAGLDQAASDLPTIILFCDYIVEDYIPVDNDALCVSKKPEGDYVVDSHPKGIPTIEEEVITDLAPNQDLLKDRYGGFTGIGIFHDTLFLKSIAYTKAYEKKMDVAYDFDIIKEYIKKVKTMPIYVSKLYEFGTMDALKKIREIHNYSR